MQNTKLKNVIAFTSVVFVGFLLMFGASAANASAAQRFIPSGIDSHNRSKAKSQVLDLASVNDDYASELAKQTGSSSFNRADYKSVGYGKAPANTYNSADFGGGSVGASAGGVGVKTLILVNAKTKVKVHIMVRCANLRLKKTPVKPKLIRISKGASVHFKKRFSQVVKTTCPSGQEVLVIVSGVATGSTKAKTTVKALGEAKVEIGLQMKAKIQLDVNVKCGTPPTTPVAPATLICTNGQVINGACQANSASQDSSQEAKASTVCDGHVISGSCNITINQTTIQNITQINANCTMLVYGDGSIVYVENGSNVTICSSTTVTPPPTSPICPPGNTWNGTICVKDSTTTPPPPATAPGMNPAPSPQDPVGSNQCYEEGTNNPVPPRTDGLCPAGSYGA